MLQKEISEVKEIVRARQGNENRIENCAKEILLQKRFWMGTLIAFTIIRSNIRFNKHCINQ